MSDFGVKMPVSKSPGLFLSIYIALVPILAVFFLIPLELYSTAAEYWRWNITFPSRFILFGLFCYFVLAITLAVLGSFSKNFVRKIALSVFYLGLLILLADVLAPLQTGLLDGSALESDEPLFYTLVELALLAFILLLSLKLGSNATRVAVLMTTFLVLVSTAYTIHAVRLHSPETNPVAPRELLPELTGNVYHIVLDEMQSDVAQAYLQNRNMSTAFDGFTFYSNNIANYLFTNVSMPSYLTGKLYKSGDFLEWQDSYKEQGLFRRMYEAGYEVQLYTVYDHWCSPYARLCRSLDEIFEEHTGLLGPDFMTYVQIWLARTLPNFMTNRALAAGKRLGSFVDAQLDGAGEKIPKTIASGRAPYSSVLMFNEMLEAEKDRAATGEYVYAHAILPHGPYVMNESCEYDANMWKSIGGKKAYFEQASCGLAKISEFLSELKRLGRYDDATIVIHADTGHGHQGYVDVDEAGNVVGKDSVGLPPIELDKRFLRSEIWYLARSMALLMIKAPGGDGPLEIADDKTQLIDVYPTIVDLAGLDPGDVDGVSLAQGLISSERESHMYFTSPARPGEVTILEISDQKAIPSSHIIVKSDDRVFPLAQNYALLFGLNDSDSELTGFSYPERDESGVDHWRWALGKSSSVDLTRRLKISAGTYILELEIQPFVVNVGSSLTVILGGARQEVILEEGWQKYRLEFSFERDARAVIDFSYPEAATPESLGISADQRPLASRLRSITIRPDR